MHPPRSHWTAAEASLGEKLRICWRNYRDTSNEVFSTACAEARSSPNEKGRPSKAQFPRYGYAVLVSANGSLHPIAPYTPEKGAKIPKHGKCGMT
jgi:hypothetical protein